MRPTKPIPPVGAPDWAIAMQRDLIDYYERLANLPQKLPEVDVADLTGEFAASNWVKHAVIVPDETGGHTICTSDGTNWLRVSDGSVAA